MPRTLLALGLGLLLGAGAAPLNGQAPADTALVHAVLRQDTLLFTAFNDCDTLTIAQYFVADLEFYHDRAGLKRGTAANVAPIAERCRQVARGEAPSLRRERLTDSDAVYPVPGFGAMQIGRHRFTQGASGDRPEQSAVFGFLHLWRHRGATWELVRVFSYDH